MKNTKTISEATPLIPDLVAETVVTEIAIYFHQMSKPETVEYLQKEGGRKLNLRLTSRAEELFQCNQNFKKKLKSEKCREYLVMFYRHWAGAFLKEMDFEYAKEVIEAYQKELFPTLVA